MKNLPLEIVDMIMLYVMESKTNRIIKDAIINHKKYKVDNGVDFFNWYFFVVNHKKTLKNFWTGRTLKSIAYQYIKKTELYYSKFYKIEINDLIWKEHKGINPLKVELYGADEHSTFWKKNRIIYKETNGGKLIRRAFLPYADNDGNIWDI